MLTVLGGVLRFSSLDRPAVWGDEGRTYARTFSSWQDMLELLRDAGFTPGSYMSAWWLGQGMPVEFRTASTRPATRPADPDFGRKPGEVVIVKRLWTDKSGTGESGAGVSTESGPGLTPHILRFFPAFYGTLMVPALYFLARRLVDRRLALWACAFAAISAYLLVYSRDAKMYMQLFFFSTLHVGCFLWWLNVTAGRWENRPRLVLKWLCWVASGMAMLFMHAAGCVVIGVELLILLTMPRAAFWFVWPTKADAPVISVMSRLLDTIRFATRVSYPAVVGFAIGAGLMGWQLAAYYTTFNRFVARVVPENGVTDINIGAAGLIWIRDYVRGREGPNLFLFDATAYLTGWEWPAPRWWSLIPVDVAQILAGVSLFIIVLLLLAFLPWRTLAGAAKDRNTARVLPVLWLLLWVVVPAYAVYCVSFKASAPDELLMHALLERDVVPSSPWKAGVMDDGRARLMSIIKKQDDVREETIRRRKAAEIAAGKSEQERAAAAVQDIDQRTTADRMLWLLMFTNQSVMEWPKWDSIKTQYSALASTSNYSWWKVLIVASGFVMIVIAHPPISRRGVMVWVDGVGVVAMLFAVTSIIYLAAPLQDEPVFMPRYIGYVWPAVAIGTVILISRLPTLGLRVAIIGLLVGVNAWQFGQRVWGDSEPPSDVIARDLFDDRENDDVQTVTIGTRKDGGPGDGSFLSVSTQYYFHLLSKDKVNAIEFQYMRYSGRMKLNLQNDFAPRRIARNVRNNKNLRRLVVWRELRSATPSTSDVGEITGALGKDWTLSNEQTWPVFDHWTWRSMYDLKRMEFVKRKTE